MLEDRVIMWVEKEMVFDPDCSHVTTIRLSVEVENWLPRSIQLNLTKPSSTRSQHIALLRAPPQCLDLSALFYSYCDLLDSCEFWTKFWIRKWHEIS
jgi:hypothetical protein